MSLVESCKCEYLDDYIVKLTAMVFESKTNQPSYVCQTLAILLRFKKYKKVVGDFFYKYPLGLQVDDLLAYIETAPNEENSTEFADSIQSAKNQNKSKLLHPSVNDGVKGIKFIFAAKKSSNFNSKWVKI